MPTTISNPATFSSVRAAFSAEGFGTSTSLLAYRQGGGIVPATSTFNVIGAGTASDPLQLSQFNGFVVPSPTGTVSLSNVTLNASSIRYLNFPTSALAGIRLLSTGELQGIVNEGNSTTGWVTQYNWLTGGNASYWSYRATLTFGSLGGSSTASGTYTTGWVPATGNPEWAVVASSTESQPVGSVIRQFTLELALTTNTSAVLASASMYIQAQSRTNAGVEP